MIYIVGIIIAFFLTFILLSKNNKTLADKVLLGWLIVIGLHLALYYVHISSPYIQYPHLFGVAIPLPIMHGPFLFLYSMALTNPAYFKNYRWLWHFAPALAMYIYLIPFFSLPVDEKMEVIRNEGADYTTFTFVSIILFIISGFGYVLWSSMLLKKHKKNIDQQFSNTEHINLKWLQYLIYCLGVTWLFVAWGNDDWIFAAASVFVLFIGYFGIKQVGIFTNSNLIASPQYATDFQAQDSFLELISESKIIENEEVAKKKYQKSGLSDEQADKVQKELTDIMQNEKLYKNPELTLADLANRLAIHPNYLSQVINEKEGVNFYDYINTLRIEEFKKQIAQPKNKQYTMLTVAYDCGFNSKSSFNRYFKKVMDVQPSEYVRGLN